MKNQNEISKKRFKQCILGTCCIPWNDDNTFAEELFRHTVRYLHDSGTPNLYLFGTAGEGYALSDVQFSTITHVFNEEMRARDAEPMIGVISLSVTQIIERIETAYALGVRKFQISLPSWGACQFGEIQNFFRSVCLQFPDCEFLNYNISRTKRMITSNEYAILQDEIPNLVAVKMNVGDISRLIEYTQKAPELQFFFGEFDFIAAGLLGLEAGFLIVI